MNDHTKTISLIASAWPALKLGISVGVVYCYIQFLERRVRLSESWRRLKVEAHRFNGLSFGDPHDALKFLNLDYWLRENIRRALRVSMHRRQRLKILDVGCGTGLFPFVCRLWGHDAMGLDKPIAACRPDEAIVYSVMPAALRV